MPPRRAGTPGDEPTTPLYVRLARRDAEVLDRASFHARVSKRELVTSALRRFLADGAPEAAAGAPGAMAAAPPGALDVGRHAFRADEPPEVLTLEEAAALLRVGSHAVTEMAEAGELPARRVAGQWRLSRAALLAWLAAA